MFVEIALNIPADKLFTYEVPDNLVAEIEIGKRVYVPFGRRKQTGFITATVSSCEFTGVRQIAEILDDEPLFSAADLAFYQWAAAYFLYPLGRTLAEIMPAGLGKKDYLRITPLSMNNSAVVNPAAKKLLAVIEQHPQGINLTSLKKICGSRSIAKLLSDLSKAGLISLEEKEKNQLGVRREKTICLAEPEVKDVRLTARQENIVEILRKTGLITINELRKFTDFSDSVLKRLEEKRIIVISRQEKIRRINPAEPLGDNPKGIILNDGQENALNNILACLADRRFAPVLLHGVTGSGKTEVYLKAIAEAIRNGGQALYLVPEIALTPQLISRVQGRFAAGQIAVLHSGIAEAVRYDQWRQIKRGLIKVVIGARSALFASLPDLRLIIVDEEHDSSYKQDERLCYNARDLAVLRAKQTGATVILGSATPGIISYFNAQKKKYRYLHLPQRVGEKPLPAIEIVDMKTLKEENGKVPLLSCSLLSGIGTAIAQKEQVLLFLNKRGFDTFLVCGNCGYQFKCPNCDVSLKHHAATGVIKCHYCDYTIKALPLCPSCRSSRIFSYGAGTQKLEAEIKRLFPAARVRRMDSDTTSGKGAQEKILRELWQREIDILVGTQMITKGHDFPFITLVGVVAADTVLNMPDFRAAERAFQQLTQVAGRGGRGDSPGRVIIQTFNPQHYALKHVQKNDYQSFYEEEISYRKELKYPPSGRIINLRLSATNKDKLLAQSEKLGKTARKLAARQGNVVEIIGPAQAPLAKIKGRWRRQMLLKSESINALHQLARELIASMEKGPVKLTVDVDAENFM